MTSGRYPYLRDVFNAFLEEKLSSLKAVKILEDAIEGYKSDWRFKGPPGSLQNLSDSLGLSKYGLYEKFLASWEALTPEQATQLFKYWNLLFCPERKLFVEVHTAYEHQALQWTVVNVIETNLFQVFLHDDGPNLADYHKKPVDWITRTFIGPKHTLPYQQCFYCGKRDTNPKGREFGKMDLCYCHLKPCPTSTSSPSAHAVGCCYGDWKRIKNNIRARLKRAAADPKRVTQIFLAFCEQRYQCNLTLRTPVRVAQEKPLQWRTPYDRLFMDVHPDGQSQDSQFSLPLFYLRMDD